MSKNFPSKEEMKARFWELTHAMDDVRAKTAAHREAHDAFVNEAREKADAMHAEIRAHEADIGDGTSMFDAQQELAFLARGLGNVGTDPDLEEEAEPEA